MFLLIPDDVQKFLKRLRTLHSNMFLLIRSGAQTGSGATASFTFQYVYINTQYVIGVMVNCRETLHSNMFLLIPGSEGHKQRQSGLYIPICFY